MALNDPMIQRLRQQVLFIPPDLWQDLETVYAAAVARRGITAPGELTFHNLLLGMLRQCVRGLKQPVTMEEVPHADESV